MLRRVLLSVVRIASAVVAVFAVLWWFNVRMPGKNVSRAATLSADEIKLRDELRADVEMLGGQISERNLHRYAQLQAAAEFIEDSLRGVGLQPRRDSYMLNNLLCHNIEAEIRSTSPEIVLVGAHYDSVFGAPGANDNGSGIAAMLALGRRFAGTSTSKTLRFVAFVNEEPPYFQTSQMGSFVYASRCRAIFRMRHTRKNIRHRVSASFIRRLETSSALLVTFAPAHCFAVRSRPFARRTNSRVKALRFQHLFLV